MSLLLHVLFCLYTLVSMTVDHVSQNLVGLILKAVLFVAGLTPNFQNFLARDIDPKDVSTVGLPALIRDVAGNPVFAFLLPKLTGVDILELTPAGTLRSLINPRSVYNGMGPDHLTRFTGLMPILLLDNDVAANLDIESVGPILLRPRPGTGVTKSRSVVVLCDEGTFDGARLVAPILLKEPNTQVINAPPESVAFNFADVLNGARGPMLKLVRGERLLPPSEDARAEVSPPRSLLKLLWTKRKCDFTWRSLQCQWQFDQADVQGMLDQTFRSRASRTQRVRLGHVEVDVTITRPRVEMAPSDEDLNLTFEVEVHAPEGQGQLTTLLQRSVLLKQVSLAILNPTYDRPTRTVRVRRLFVSGLELPEGFGPDLEKVAFGAINTILARKFGPSPAFSLKTQYSIGAWLLRAVLRSLHVGDQRVHVRAGIGRCEETLGGPPRAT